MDRVWQKVACNVLAATLLACLAPAGAYARLADNGSLGNVPAASIAAEAGNTQTSTGQVARLPDLAAAEIRCLSLAIYHEARGEPAQGQFAVGQVILNRVRSPLFPETICGVVYQGQMHKGCQFSFTCDGRTDNPKKGSQWELAQDLSRKITSGQAWLPEVGYSTFYHANYVKPRWVRAMSRIDSIGRHIFYKKRNETPYIVEASATETTEASVPTVSLASTAGASLSSTPAMSLGFAASE